MRRIPDFPQSFFIGISLLPVLAVFVPRALAFYPALLGLLGVYVLGFQQKQSLSLPRAYCAVVAALSALWLVGCLWSVDPQGSFENAILKIPVLVGGIVFIMACRALPLASVRPVLWVFPAAMIFAAFFFSMELALNLPFYRWIHGLDPLAKQSTAVVNRGIIALVLSTVTGLAFLKFWPGEKNIKHKIFCMLALCFACFLILTQSQSAQLCVLVGLFFFLVFPIRSHHAFSALKITLVLLVILAPWVSLFLYNYLLDYSASSQWLNDGYASSRIEIWSVISEMILKRPWVGHGLESTKLIGSLDRYLVFQNTWTILHPHNFALQIWMDLGVPGVILCVFIFYIIFKGFQELQAYPARVCLATFMMVLTVSAVGYGLWQSWWMGFLILLLGLCILVGRLAEDETQK